MIRRAALLLLFALFGCERISELPVRKAVKKNEEERPRYVDADGDNLLNIAYGAAVVSRTEELDLEQSALHAIDGMSSTQWATPRGNPNQTMTFSFGAPVRVDKVGLISRSRAAGMPEKVRFSASADGREWRVVGTVATKVTPDAQLITVPPFEANFLRVETSDPTDREVQIGSVQAFGKEIYPPELKPFDGCWIINGERALIAQHGARLTGVMGEGEHRTAIDGGIDGRVARVMWRTGPMWGYAAMTLTADSRHLSALTFHQNPLTGFVGRAWFGERCESTEKFEAMPPEHFVNVARQWTLYGLAFDDREQLMESMSRDTLDIVARIIAGAPTKRFRISAYEFRHGKEENRRRSAARIASLRTALEARGVDLSRVDLVAHGDEWSLAEPVFAVQQLLWSRIHLALQ